MPTFSPLHVSGKHIINGNGAIVFLRGNTIYGGEFSLTGNHYAVSDFSAQNAWNANCGRITLAANWWLGNTSGYQASILAAIANCKSVGMYMNLAIQWQDQTAKQVPDITQTIIDAWSSIAHAVGNDPALILTTLAEPHGNSNSVWQTQTQACVNAIRATGFTGVITCPYNGWAGAVNNGVPSISDSNYVHDVHSYQFWTPGRSIAPDGIPSWIGECGNNTGPGAGNVTIPQTEQEAYNNGCGFFGWVWDTRSDTQGLISSFSGTPKQDGIGIRAWMLTLPIVALDPPSPDPRPFPLLPFNPPIQPSPISTNYVDSLADMSYIAEGSTNIWLNPERTILTSGAARLTKALIGPASAVWKLYDIGHVEAICQRWIAGDEFTVWISPDAVRWTQITPTITDQTEMNHALVSDPFGASDPWHQELYAIDCPVGTCWVRFDWPLTSLPLESSEISQISLSRHT